MKTHGKTTHLSHVHAELDNPAPATPASPVQPPDQKAPETPVGFTPPRLVSGRFQFLSHAQIGASDQLGKDLAVAEQADFGSNAPSVVSLGAMLDVASDWSEERERTERWLVYTKAQEARAWTPLLDEMEALKPAFEYAVLRDGSLAKKYASLTAYYGVKKAAAQRGARTRKAHAHLTATAAPVAPVIAAPPPDPTKAGPTS